MTTHYKIADIQGTTATVTIGPGPSILATVTSHTVGTFARITAFGMSGWDSYFQLYQGNGTTGTMLWNSAFAQTVIITDPSPVATYTMTASGDGSESGEQVISLSVEQIHPAA
jgi:hypothetical protein